MPSREQEELVDSFREDFGEVEVRAFSLETAMTLDDDADPEDVEASWNRASEPASSSSAAASSGNLATSGIRFEVICRKHFWRQADRLIG